MSLINDALKRASETQKRQPRQPRMPEAIMQATETPAAATKSWWPLVGWISVFVLVVGAGCWLVWRGWKGVQPAIENQQAKVTATTIKPPPVATAAKSNAPVEVKSIAPANPPPAIATKNPPVEPKPAVEIKPSVPVPPPPAAAVSTTPPAPKPTIPNPPPASTPPEVNPVPAPAPAPVTFPALKLQGIIYVASNPSALINGRTLYIGETIEAVRVVRVERESVVLEFGGQTNTFYLLR